ncbi:MAG: hypothetical protein ACK5IQ_08985 [Bacteroidales bacterium]
MKQVILNIKDGKYRFFMELVKSLDFVQVEEADGDSKKDIVKNLTRGFQDLKLYKQGRLKTTSAKDFLNDL